MRRFTSMFLAFCCCYGAEAAGVLGVSSEPSGATVSLDGKRIGRAPCKVGVPAGQHTVTASARRYDSDTKVVNIKDGEETSVQLTLLPTPVTIKVKCKVKDAAVYIDGTKVGLVNQIVKARPGLREIAVVKDGYKDWVRKAQIPWKGPKTYTAKLVPGVSFFSGVVPLTKDVWRNVKGWRFSGGSMIFDGGDWASAELTFERRRAYALMCRYRATNIPNWNRQGVGISLYKGHRDYHGFEADGEWHVMLLRIEGREVTETTDGKLPCTGGTVEGSPIDLRISSSPARNNRPFRVEITMLVIKQFKSAAEMTAAVQP